MKLMIDIPEKAYRDRKMALYFGCYSRQLHSTIYNGIPLDDVKAEISEEICLTDNPYTKETKYTIEHSKLLEILDNIGKTESEV